MLARLLRNTALLQALGLHAADKQQDALTLTLHIHLTQGWAGPAITHECSYAVYLVA